MRQPHPVRCHAGRRDAGHGWKAPSTNDSPECETRYLAEQRCHDCSRPCQRLGAGGICPYCEEMIIIEELTEDTGASSPLPAASTHP